MKAPICVPVDFEGRPSGFYLVSTRVEWDGQTIQQDDNYLHSETRQWDARTFGISEMIALVGVAFVIGRIFRK